MKEEYQVIIVGGGAMGTGLMYHLAHEGWTDVLLIEKGELTSAPFYRESQYGKSAC